MNQIIYTEIRNNIPLRQSIAGYLGITENTVYRHAVNCAPKLNDAIVVEIIKKHTGKSLEQIFTVETLNFIK